MRLDRRIGRGRVCAVFFGTVVSSGRGYACVLMRRQLIVICVGVSLASCGDASSSTDSTDTSTSPDVTTDDANRSDASFDDGTIGPETSTLDTSIVTDTPESGTDAPDVATDVAIDSPTDAATVDPFGVREIYPTLAAGREWYLPADADVIKGEWSPETDDVTKVSAGVFHTFGEGGQVRLNVVSPAGKAWWRNVEMTGYFRYTADKVCCGQVQHWELFARGERHSETNIAGTAINGGVAAPAGTATWPGYPYGSSTVDVHCLGTAYHGNVYPTGRVLFEKEVAHFDGYAPQKGVVTLDRATFPDPKGRWFGLKFVVRNAGGASSVHLEVWLDEKADGVFRKVTELDDTKGSWAAPAGSLDGCDAAPFSYKLDQLMTWAGPWVTFRSDSIETDFKWLSVREIAPL